MSFALQSVEAVLMALSVRLKRARLEANLTQRELAERVGVSLKTVSNAEDGKNISLETFVRLLAGIGRLRDLDPVLEDVGPSPVELAKRRGRRRQRARSGAAPSDADWQW